MHSVSDLARRQMKRLAAGKGSGGAFSRLKLHCQRCGNTQCPEVHLPAKGPLFDAPSFGRVHADVSVDLVLVASRQHEPVAPSREEACEIAHCRVPPLSWRVHPGLPACP